MFDKVLIANRGEIACRIIRTLRRLGIGSVAVYSEADADARHAIEADEAYCIGEPAPAASYLNIARIIGIARDCGAQAIHPGYGFLSENPDFAEQCAASGITFIGPSPESMRAFGLKHRARELAELSGVPLLPGSGILGDERQAVSQAARIGYPVMLKSTAGGGGIGMALCRDEEELLTSFAGIERLARNNFKECGLFLEKYVSRARHVEVQIFGDGQGNAITLGTRDCSVQRRNQKVIEETPAPGLSSQQSEALCLAARRLAETARYESAGTVEFVLDADNGEFSFLEVNTRLQVEHTVTEEVHGIDLVEWMIRQACGELPPLADCVPQSAGCAMQVRIYAEDPGKNFQPCSGILTDVFFPREARCDGWVERGTTVTAYYDPLLAKLIVTGRDRKKVLEKMTAALAQCRLAGIETNLPYLRMICADNRFTNGNVFTRMLETLRYQAPTIDVLASGTSSTIQDYPGRIGYWEVGVPPSGPMDHLSFRLGNRLLGNSENAAGLELTITGPTLQFNADTTVCLTGATMKATLNGAAVPFWQVIPVCAGDILKLGNIDGAGQRSYLTIRGGFDVPEYLGSRSTFTLGEFGGHGGRAMRAGDVLHFFSEPDNVAAGTSLPEAIRPVMGNRWEIGVLYGPHGAPDFFTEQDITTFFATDWEVHYNSARTGVRLIGPKPDWARQDGGEAGLHPSNIHDNAYAIGTVDFTGDMPIILGPDGPSLGGFVCPVTIVQAELWKMGQLHPGDRVRFVRISQADAELLEHQQERMLEILQQCTETVVSDPAAAADTGPVIATLSAAGERPRVVYRRSGDKYLLIEYGEPCIDLNYRFRAHALMEWLRGSVAAGILDLTPGIRSLQVHYDSRVLPLASLLALLQQGEEGLPPLDDLVVPSRIVHLPLSWDDPATRLAIEKYSQSVRPDAPWCPSNIEFIRRINGLESIEEVQQILFNASYLVMGLGDVYLGAPVATPLDPRQRLVTTKYNPARTWTPENAVGIGGAYLCVYGMEGPGGYQFVGRTVQMWNRYRQTGQFEAGKPWLLRHFDQLRFYPVSHEELQRMRREFINGSFSLKIEEASLGLRDYHAFLAENEREILTAKERQAAAFEAERQRWEASGQAHFVSESADCREVGEEGELVPGCEAVASPVSGVVWKIVVQVGDRVREGDCVVIMESMKMESAVLATCSGVVEQLFCGENAYLNGGRNLLSIRPD
ncbi:MAG: urea carboxylase [Geobacteraceae bacterium]|nr:urea carboxylase [Geobacteraceae bacterium]